MIKSHITTEILVSNKTILPDGYSSIFIQNNSDTNVTVLDNIVLQPREFFSFSEEADIVIDTNIPVVFDITATDKKILVIKSYYRKQHV